LTDVKTKKTNFVKLKHAAELSDISIELLKKCIKVGIADYKIEEDEILVDVHSIRNFISLKETALLLSVSPRTIRRYTKRTGENRLKSHQFRKDFSYQLSDIEEFIKKSVF
jgi:hypothetical protein